MRFAWFLVALLLSFTLAVLQQWAVADHLYWRYEWFDVLMHFLGGLTIASILIALLSKFRPAWFGLLLVGVFIGWEVFEYVFGIPRESNYVFDTALDFLMDALGALAVYVVARYTLWRSV